MRGSKKQKATFPACPMPKLKHYQCENIHKLPKKKITKGEFPLWSISVLEGVFFFFFCLVSI